METTAVYVEAKSKAEAIRKYERCVSIGLKERRSKHPDLFPPRNWKPIQSKSKADQGITTWLGNLMVLIKIICLQEVEDSPFESTEQVLERITECIERILIILNFYYSYQIFGTESKALSLYDTLKTEEDIAFELALAGFLISSIPGIIDPLISDPKRYPLFHGIVFGEQSGPYDVRCMDLVEEFESSHQPRNHPSYEIRKETTAKLLQVESFRAHHFMHYLITPFWIYASHSPHVPEPIKLSAVVKILLVTTKVPRVILCGTAVFAILGLETNVTRAESKIFLRGHGYLSMVIGTLLMPMDKSRHLNHVCRFLDTLRDPAAVARTLQNERVQHDLEIALAWTFDTWELAIREGVDILGPNDTRMFFVSSVLLDLFRSGGISLIVQAGYLCWFSSTLAAFAQRLSEDPEKEKYGEFEGFTILFWRMMHYRPYGPRRRGFIFLIKSLDEVPPDSDLTFEQVGCMNFGDCPKRERLRRIQELNKEDRTEEEIQYIKEFGLSDRFCGGCRQVIYCSKGCQRSHWRKHRSACQAHRLGNVIKRWRFQRAKGVIRSRINSCSKIEDQLWAQSETMIMESSTGELSGRPPNRQ